jgi:hypothetical protein
MLDYDRFADHVAAHLRYTEALPPGAALAIVRHRLADGSWRQAPNEWLSRGLRLAGEGRPAAWPISACLTELVAAIVEGPIDDAAHSVLPDLCSRLATQWRDGATIGGLASWFARRAHVGDASLAAEMLERLRDHESRFSLPPCALPLALWLLENGSPELRSARRSKLLPAIADLVAERMPDQLPLVLRYIVRNERPADAWSFERREGVWPQVEAALAHGASGSLAVDLVLAAEPAFTAWGASAVLFPLAPRSGLPLARAALLAALVHGDLPSQRDAEAWSLAIGCNPPEQLPPFGSVASLDAAANALINAARQQRHPDSHRGPHDVDPEQSPDRIERWAHLVVTQLLRVHGIVRGQAKGTRTRLEQMASWPPLAVGIHDALSEALAGEPESESFSLVRELLREGSDVPRVTAAVAALPRQVSPRRKADAPRLDAVGDQLTRIVRHPWVRPAFGIDLARLLGATGRVEFAELENEQKVRLDGETVLVDRSSIADAIAGTSDEDRALAYATLYFVHELIHVGQGIGPKEHVAQLRAAGGETTLLHLDLSADHTAALLTAEAMPRWSVEWLKDLQSRPGAFPVGPRHTPASRARKALRLVSVRLDYLVRARKVFPLERIGDGYVFADFGPAGGAFLVMTAGPPFGLLGTGRLEPGDAERLHATADPDRAGAAGLAGTDAILLRTLAGLAGR